MRTRITLGVAAVALALPVAPATAAPSGQASDAARAVVTTFYKQTPAQRRNVCQVWRVQPVKFGRKMVRALVRIGYSPRPAARGVVAGMVTVCGQPYGYGGAA